MASYRLTRLADGDLVEIARYTRETWGERQREKYIRELFALFEDIAVQPMQSRRVDFIRPGLRKRIHPKRLHVIYFRLGPDGVPEILRVLHTRQNRDKAFE